MGIYNGHYAMIYRNTGANKKYSTGGDQSPDVLLLPPAKWKFLGWTYPAPCYPYPDKALVESIGKRMNGLGQH